MDGLQLQLPNLPEQTHCPIVNDSLHACNQRVFECLPNFARTFPLFLGLAIFCDLEPRVNTFVTLSDNLYEIIVKKKV